MKTNLIICFACCLCFFIAKGFDARDFGATFHHSFTLTPEEERKEMVYNLEDQFEVAEYAKYDHNQHVRHVALNRLDDHDRIIDVAYNSPYADTRSRAIREIFSKTALETIISNDSDGVVVLLAERRLKILHLIFRSMDTTTGKVGDVTFTDEEKTVLAEYAKTESHPFVRMSALDRLRDQSFVIDVAKNSTYMDTILGAIAKVENGDVLHDLANDNAFDQVRQFAAKRLDILANKTEVADILVPTGCGMKSDMSEFDAISPLRNTNYFKWLLAFIPVSVIIVWSVMKSRKSNKHPAK